MITLVYVFIFNPIIMKANAFKVGVCACLLVCWSCMEGTNQSKVEQLSFPVTSPLVVDTVYTKEYVTTIASLQNVEIRSKIEGYIEAVLIDEGRAVHSGQTLFRIGGQRYRQELNKAQATLKSARSEAKTLELEIKNIRHLVEQKIVGKTELEIAESKLETLKARIEEAESDAANAQLQLSMTEIKAPFGGVVGRIPNKVGSLVDEGTLLTIVSNNQEVYAYFNVTEKEYLDFTAQNEINRRRPVTLILANGQPYSQRGIIETIDSQFDKNTGNIAFRAKFPNPQQILKNGASGKIQLTNTIKNALVVPHKAIFEVQDRNCLYVVDAQNKVSIRNVQILQRLPQLYVIESGLDKSEKILYEGIQRVAEGDVITPQFVSMRQAMASNAKN